MRFCRFVNESVTSTEAVELAIVNLWNNESIKNKKSMQWIDTAVKVVEFLKSKGITGKAEDLGRKKFPVTNLWERYKKGKDTSKTDIKIGNYKISVKVETSQLLASAKDETRTTFYSVMEKYDYDKIISEEIVRRVEGFARGRTTLGTNPKNTADSLVKEIDKYHKETQEYFKKLLSQDRTLMMRIVHEAMSGRLKFGRNSDASCDWILILSKDGNSVRFESVDSEPFLNYVLDNTSISVRFKTTSVKTKNAEPNERNYWSVLMMVHKHTINESLKSFISNVISKIKNFLKKGIDKIFDFIGIEPVIKIK